MPDFNAPNLTPEDITAIQQAQAQAQAQGGEVPPAGVGGTPQDPNAGMGGMPQGMPQEPQGVPQGQPATAGQPTPDELEMAKKLLGIEEIQKQAQEAQEKLKQIEMERTKSVVMSKYPNVPIDLVEQEIAKVEQTNPQLAEAMKLNPDLMEMAVKAVLASVKPNEKPDNITQGSGASDTSPEDEITDKVKKGQADQITLGDYILNISSKK